jgi:multidrug resistance efflux pump
VRTLQRLSHQRPTDVDPLARLRRERVEQIEAKRRVTWQRVGKAVGSGLLLLAILIGPVLWVRSQRMVVEGLVQGVIRVERAPVDARVAEIACRAGQRVEPGDLLLRLETVGGEYQLRPLELDVEQARLRLSILRAGGALDERDPLRREELLQDAQARASAARSSAGVLFTRALELARECEALERRLSAEKSARAEARAALDIELNAARTREAALGSLAGEAKTERERLERLQAQGLVAARDAERARATAERAATELEGAQAAVRAHVARVAAAQDADSAHEAWGRAELAARAEQQRALEIELAAAREEEQRWTRLAEERERWAPPGDAQNLRDLELTLAEKALAQAQARFEAQRRARGEGWVRAQAGGVIDRIGVHEGSAVESGAELLAYVDTERLWVEAYLSEDDVERAEIGAPCRLLLGSEDEFLDARCSAIGVSWIPCPREFEHSRSAIDLRLPARIEISTPYLRGRGLRPGSRVQVLFDLASSRAARSDGREANP